MDKGIETIENREAEVIGMSEMIVAIGMSETIEAADMKEMIEAAGTRGAMDMKEAAGMIEAIIVEATAETTTSRAVIGMETGIENSQVIF